MAMDTRTLRRKLKLFVELGNELDAEAKRRYGPEGLLFHEADGTMLIMSQFTGQCANELSKYVKFEQHGVLWGAGAF